MYPRFVINNTEVCNDLWKGIRFLRIDSPKTVAIKVMENQREISSHINEKRVDLFIEQGVWKEIKEEEAALL